MNESIAVIGVGLDYPRCQSTYSFWNSLCKGINFIGEFPEKRKKDMVAFYKEALKHKVYSNTVNMNTVKGAYLEEIDKFDNQFFKISPAEATLMDPCQRIFLQVAYSAVEDAGYGGDLLKKTKTGVFVGFMPDFRPFNYKDIALNFNDLPLDLLITSNLVSIIPSRISYFLDLIGPTFMVDTSCSASLVAVHLACQSIRNNESDMAIAGGIKLNLAPFANILRPVIESPTGYSKTFDNNADGIGIGEGAGAVLLKPLDKAIEDRDNIYAIIKGSAVNQDGRSTGMACPNADSQTRVILDAWKNSHVNPENITYIEAHGTGTKVGDPIEVNALIKAFEKFTNKKQFCAISSVKTNVGHLYEGAGITSFIKAVLCLKNKKLPETLHFKESNKSIDFINSPFYVTGKIEDWSPKIGGKLLCGINAFGISGTNCHMVLEEYVNSIEHNIDSKLKVFKQKQIFCLSAHNMNSLFKTLKIYVHSLEKDNSSSIRDICYTVNTGRGHYKCRLAILCDNKKDLKEKILLFLEKKKEFLQLKIFFGEFISEKKLVDCRNKDIQSLANLYTQGYKIDWKEIYRGEKRLKVSLPTYQFEKKRFWYDLSDITYNQVQAHHDYFYELSWIKKKELSTQKFQKSQSFLILGNDNYNITNYLKEQGHSVIVITENDKIKLRLAFEKVNFKSLNYIIHSSTIFRNCVKSWEDIDDNLKYGIYQLHYLLEYIINKSYDLELEIIILTENSEIVDGKEVLIKPENASLIGFAKSIRKEFSHIKARALDIDNTTSINNIANEILTNSEYFLTAYRENKRYIQEFRPVDFKDLTKNEKIDIKSRGVYIITGGTGGIGLSFALFLAKKNKVNIALFSRSGAIKGDDKEKLFKEVESCGAKLEIFKARTEDFASMKILINSLRTKYGRINGIIHCAGVAGSSFAGQQDLIQLQEVIMPKIKGTMILDELTVSDNIDFFISCSSVATIFPAVGQGDYCAANSFIDSYTRFKNKLGKRYIAINWVAWKDIGMAKDYGTNVNTSFLAISNEDAINSFEKVLDYNIPTSLIGRLNTESNTILNLKDYGLELSDEVIKVLSNFQNERQNKNSVLKKKVKNPKLLGKKSGEYTNIERNIANIWGKILRYEEININENLYDIGGDSLTALEITSRCNKDFSYKFNVHDVLKCGNIANLAKFINEKSKKNG